MFALIALIAFWGVAIRLWMVDGPKIPLVFIALWALGFFAFPRLHWSGYFFLALVVCRPTMPGRHSKRWFKRSPTSNSMGKPPTRFYPGSSRCFLMDDFGIRKGFSIAFKKRQMPRPEQVLKHGERWKPHRSIASWYLWRAVDLVD